MVEKLKETLANLEEDFEIIEDDFKMVFDGRYKFDLYFMHHKKVKKGESPKEPEWKLHGYNMQISSCIKSIILHRINAKHDVLSFKEFFIEFKKMHNELTTLLTEITGEGF